MLSICLYTRVVVPVVAPSAATGSIMASSSLPGTIAVRACQQILAHVKNARTHPIPVTTRLTISLTLWVSSWLRNTLPSVVAGMIPARTAINHGLGGRNTDEAAESHRYQM